MLDPFIKRVDLADGGFAFQVERARAERMTAALASLPGMRTPTLLDADPATGTLFFERLETMAPLHAGLRAHWFERAGTLLAHIHRSLELPAELTRDRPEDAGRQGTVYVHGDYMPNNLAIVGADLVVFDWGLRPWGQRDYTRASPAVDLTAFIAPWLVPRWWDPRLPVRSLRRFLDAWREGIGPKSASAQLAGASLEDAFGEHVRYNSAAVARRRGPRRAVLGVKTAVNTWLTRQAVLGRALAREEA